MDEQKIVILGANGQLGTAVSKQYPHATALTSDNLDLADQTAIADYDWDNFDVIINAAGFTDVDGAETTEGRIKAWQINAAAIGYIKQACSGSNPIFVHISTDYVFDGSRALHDENESLSPLSVYGASKAAGDLLAAQFEKHYILRTSWIIGEGKNFVRTMLELGKNGTSPTVVSDQTGRLTFTPQLVQAIDHLLANSAAFGTYNVSNAGDIVSWAEITREIFKLAGLTQEVKDISSKQYYEGKSSVALRPLKSALNLDKIQATGLVLDDWHQALQEYIKKEMAS